MFTSYFVYLYLFILSFLPISSWTHGLIGQPESFIPNEVQTDSEKIVSNLVFRKLVNVNPFTGEIKYDLLKNYTVSDDGLTYVIELKQNQYWQDGFPIMADDVLYTASLSPNLREVSSDKVDDYKVRFSLPNKYSPFLSVLAIGILPSHLQDQNSKLISVGSGDYRIVRVTKDRTRIEEVVLVTRSGKYPYKKLNFRFYENEDYIRVAAKIKEIGSMLFNKKEDISGFNAKKYVFYGRSYLLVFDTKKDYLDKDTRKSIVNMINYDEIIKNQEYQDAERPFGPFSSTWAQSDSYERPMGNSGDTLDIKKDLVLVIPNVNEARLIAQNIKKQIESSSDHDVEIKALSSKDYIVKIRDTKYDMVLLAQEYGLDPDRFVFWHSTQNSTGLNFSNSSAIRIDKSLEEGRETVELEDRKVHYNIFQSVFSEETPAVFILHPSQYLYYSNSINNIPEQKYFYPWSILDNFDKWEKVEPTILL
ncbi:hypothetical protein COV24_02855 [candidate division WWE3 bacterium CG10_big_fil_rev_8_21_14_0_10_32_10]|uniref:Solute-binding protein family 5 domain-containing protein n=1 Tax=candidate division WWE3 bacterium CG10_big_fil_rev_8_21_14_0_10_32_10 TaxID=1975090 RepID=A0A2H0RAS5_UNCKA|nr:MAG: hypothetical protein COV24_02855 [candidate division WWE3 bacterium CG10_big_fil_rev_8_21_14_0_10_32_10]